ncbi:MAG: hypothetical protein IJN43_09210, partial [Ruminococcus sp.]|nr:hypothetical protein [Ruminococcus sp.]
MKKLLSAVTSVLMASSFVTSAFASSFNVSAAGGVSAVQPNVSMEDVVDGAANKYAVQSDFIVTGTELKYDPNGENYMDFYVESNGHKGAMIVFEIGSLPSGVTVEVDPMSMSFAHNPQWSLMNKTWNLDCMDPTTKDPLAFDDSKYLVSFKIDVASSVKDGTYEIGFDRFHVVEQPHQNFGPIVEFDATVVPGKLIVGEGGPVSTQPTTTKPAETTKPADTTQPSGDTQADFIVKGSKITYDPNGDNYMDFFVESNGHKGAMIVFEIGSLPSGVTVEVDPMSMSFAHNPQWSLMNKTWNLDCMDPTSKDPLAFDDSKYVVSFKINASSSVKDGTYKIGFSRFHVVEQPHQNFGPIVEFDATIIPGELTIGEGGDVVEDPTDDEKPTDDGETASDFIVKGSTVKYDPAKDNYMDFFVESNGHKGAMIVFEIGSLPSGITVEVDPMCMSFAHNPQWSLMNKTWNLDCMDPTSKDPLAFDDSQYVVSFKITAASTVKDGTYEIDFSRFHVVEQPHQNFGPIVEFNATTIPGKLIIGEGGPVVEDPTDGGEDDDVTADDFIVKGSTVYYDPSKDNYMDFFVESNGHKGAMIVFEIGSLPAGVTVEVDPICMSFAHNPQWSLMSKTWNLDCMDPTSKDPLAFDDSQYVVSFKITADSSVKAGTYEIDFSRFHVVEQPHQNFGPIVEFNATTIPGKLIIGDPEGGDDDGPTDSDNTTPDDFVIKGATLELTKGSDYSNAYIDFTVEPGNHKAATLACEIATLPAGIKGSVTEPLCYAIDGSPAWTEVGSTYQCYCADPATHDPQSFIDGGVVISVALSIPADIAAGEYEIDLKNFHVVEQGSQAGGKIVEFDSKVVPGKLIIKDKADDQPAADGTATWVIDTVTGTPGEEVTVPVYVDGASTLAVAGASFTIAASGADFAKVDANSAAYGNAPITNNAATNEFAFAQADGKGSAAADKAVIMNLTYKVPADAKGTIPVKWSEVVVSDTNGNLITEKVKLTDGAIVISDIPAAEGEAAWVIDTVKGTPGKAVTVPVYVDGASTLEVAGATFTITANGADFAKVDANSAAYGNAPITNNAETNQFAFAQADGKGSAAADKAVIMNLTYNVPADAKGTIPVEWADVTVSDTNGNIITSKVKVTNGAIVIDEPVVADGEAAWVIDTVKGTPGKTVEVPVYVDGASTLEVAGATFTITANGAGFNKVSGNSAAYGNAPITNNAATNEFAFAQADGKGSAAADKAVIMVLTYDVPADAKGTIPVEWANVVVSDTNGNLITEKVKVTNGAIVIDELVVADGEATWVIDTVEGVPGQTVEVPVYVDGASTLEVAGATFTINSEAGFNKVSGNSAAYGNAPITNNAETSQFAFAQADGKGSAAADKAVIMVITYNVPADATEDIPVTWADVTVSDTNGNIITEKVNVVNGKIVIKPVTTTAPNTTEPGETTTTEPVSSTTTTEPKVTSTTTTEPVGTSTTTAPNADVAEWVISTVVGKPGETVNLNVYVNGTNTVAVAGAEYTINAEGVTLEGASANSEAYGNAPITLNKATSEFAWAQAGGKESVAADKAVIMVISYKIPENATGTIPVKWADVQVSDTNGNLITDKIKPIDGAIIIDKDVSTEPTTTTTTEPVTTTTTTTTKPGSTTTTTKPVTTTTTKPVTTTTTKPGSTTTTTTTKPVTTTTTEPGGSTEPGSTTTTTTTKPVTTTTTKPVTTTTTKPVTTTTTEPGGSTEPGGTTTTTEPGGSTEPGGTTTTTEPGGSTEPGGTTTTTEPGGSTEPGGTTTAPKGAIEWVGETVTAVPGQEVTLSFVVNDPNGAKLEVGGAQFTVDADGNVKLVGGTGSEAYGSEFQKNIDTLEFAFANAKGSATVAPDGSKVITLTLQVPEDAKPGDEFSIGLSDLNVSDADGNDITDKVKVVNGKITVVAPATTEPGETTTTTEPGGSTEPGGTTTTTEPGGSTEPGGTTTTTEPGGSTEPGGTTTTTTEPGGSTEPGGTTTTTTEPGGSTEPGGTTTTTT